jgi:hypothetical protein
MVGGLEIWWDYLGEEGIRDLINDAQVFNPDKPVSMFFDVVWP